MVYTYTINESPFQYALGDIYLHLSIPNDKYEVFVQNSYDGVIKKYNEYVNNLINIESYLKIQSNYTSIPLRKKNYIGIYSKYDYNIKSIPVKYNIYRIIAFFLSICIFYKAKDLVKKDAFYYSTGFLTGLFMSFFIIVFIMYRFMPKKTSATVLYLGGWSFISFTVSLFWNEIKDIITRNFLYFQFYVTIITLLVMGFFYKQGPPKDVRSINLIQWSLQLLSLVVLFFTSQIMSFSITIIVLLLLIKLILTPTKIIVYKMNEQRKKLFPSPIKPRKFLTKEEYDQEGEEYTRKELEKLKEFCASPDADAWKLVSKVKESKKLAQFVYDDEDPVTYIGFRPEDFDVISESSDYSDDFVQEQIDLLKKNLKRNSKERQKYPYKRSANNSNSRINKNINSTYSTSVSDPFLTDDESSDDMENL
uniref:Nuclear envelope integral membrane protein 1 n=1 Tax=Parastrongyloides trichosuri TaxID=131310 RepID=A0A0N4ZVJ2_PARTI